MADVYDGQGWSGKFNETENRFGHGAAGRGQKQSEVRRKQPGNEAGPGGLNADGTHGGRLEEETVVEFGQSGSLTVARAPKELEKEEQPTVERIPTRGNEKDEG